MNKKGSDYWRSFREEKHNLAINTRKALFRSLLILGVIGVLTWVGKFKDITVHPPRYDELLIWMFPDSLSSTMQYSTLIVLPNDGVLNNDSAEGARIWFFPGGKDKSFLDSNRVQYEANDLFIPTGVSTTQLEKLCNDVDAQGFLWTSNRASPNNSFNEICPKFRDLDEINIHLQDKSLDTIIQFADEPFYILQFAGQKIAIHWDEINSLDALTESMDHQDSLLLFLHLQSDINGPELAAKVEIYPDSALQGGGVAPNLIPSNLHQALTIRINPKGQMFLKKIIMPKHLKAEEKDGSR